MSTAPQVLIAGAGPTGLAAALFLSRRGVPVRILDAAPEPAATSKALGVNPRTLALLEPTGVTAAIESEAHAITIVTDDEISTMVLNVASGTFRIVSPLGHVGAPTRIRM